MVTAIYRYPLNALAPDLMRAAGGIAVTAGPLPWLIGSPVAFAVMAALALAFVAFGVSTLIRRSTVVELGPAGISTSGLRRVRVDWDKIARIDLRYFSTRRDREKGWMQLRVYGDGSAVRLDSALDGFAEVAAAAAEAALQRGVPISEPTRANLRAIGVEPERLVGAQPA